ncbi:hypothetical protein [Actinomyces oris]|uniref:hypothetical protein n=1 Tax=Actinomyces oris TaxID=544580 RepID=UPI0028528ACE|nr:hypothetical protein [Actinomyces oris]
MGVGALTLLAMSACGSLSPGSIQARRRIKQSLKSFDVVKSVDVEVEYNFEIGNSWKVLILLNNDPGREETLAVLKDAHRRVKEVVGNSYFSVSTSWIQNGASVSWSISGKEENEATLDYLRDLAKPSLKSMNAGGNHISVSRGEVKEFPADVIMAPRSGVGVDDSFDLDGTTIKVRADTVDFSSVPLREVVDTVDPKYRKEARVELTDDHHVYEKPTLEVSAFGTVSDGFDATAAAKVLNIVSGNQALQSLYVSTVSDQSSGGTEGVRFQMDAGTFDAGYPPEEGAKVRAAARESAS